MNNENVGEILQSEMPIEVEGEVQARSEKRMQQLKKELRRIEEEFDSAREQWRNDRRALVLEIEQLEEAVDHAVEAARRQLSEDLHSELRFQIDELTRSREQLQEDLASDRQKYEADRNNLKAQITAMEGSFIDAVQRSNNPARQVMSVRDQIDARLSEAKQEWQLEWSAERRRLLAEIERLKKTGLPVDDKKEARAAPFSRSWAKFRPVLPRPASMRRIRTLHSNKAKRNGTANATGSTPESNNLKRNSRMRKMHCAARLRRKSVLNSNHSSPKRIASGSGLKKKCNPFRASLPKRASVSLGVLKRWRMRFPKLKMRHADRLSQNWKANIPRR
jgi:hypothetical protein